MNSWQTTLYVTPQAKQRPRITKSGRAYTPAQTANSEKMIRILLTNKQAPQFEGAIVFTATFYFHRPKSIKPDKRPHHTVKPDLDNLLKLVLDACIGILFQDDSQIVQFGANTKKLYIEPTDSDQKERIAIEVLKVC